MSRTTISFGIDLGTTNSSIAVCNGTETEIIKNEDNFDTTPSAVWMGTRGRLIVGRAAKDKFIDDAENTHQEFKRKIGKSEVLHFPAADRQMTPEALSAEVLKDLRRSANVQLSEEVAAAVITVPADFNASQVEATNEAARLAGFRQSVLITEPVAAALAYGFDKRQEKSRWLVYDFGGGTFDAALIQVQDGIIQVRDSAGDKFLGGKNIDDAIVDECLIPAVRSQCRLPSFGNQDKRWYSALAKLKYAAEVAKIRLSRADSAFIDIDDLDGYGPFEFELKRSVLERLAEPFIIRSIRFCRQVLEKNHLVPGDVDCVILVGGPTLMPIIRRMLSDPATGLGIRLEFGVDPFTVVARGAAVFAATQPLNLPESGPAKGEYHVRLDYCAIGPDPDPQVSGQAIGNNTDFSGWSIEFVNTTSRPIWRSGRLSLTSDGRFMTQLFADSGPTNLFQVELQDQLGTIQKTTPSLIPYTINTAPEANPPLMHDIGVALADNTMETFFKKGTPLPARKRTVLYTSAVARPGENNQQLIKVPVIQGNYPRADRNEEVGSLDVTVANLRRELPAGSEVEVTIEVNTQGLYKTRLFIPALGDDGEFENFTIKDQKIDPIRLKADASAARDRISSLRKQADEKQDPQAKQIICEIEREHLPQELAQCADAAIHDLDAAGRADNLRRDLDARLDAVEAALEWPRLVDEAQEEIKRSRDVVEKAGDADDKRAIRVNVNEVEEAIQLKDKVMLRQRLEELEIFKISVLRKDPAFWGAIFLGLEQDKDGPRFCGRPEASRLFNEGRRAIMNNNLPALQDICRQLFAVGGVSEEEAGSHIGLTRR